MLRGRFFIWFSGPSKIKEHQNFYGFAIQMHKLVCFSTDFLQTSRKIRVLPRRANLRCKIFDILGQEGNQKAKNILF